MSALVRPEDIVIGTEGVTATVVASSFLGSLRRTQVRLADGSLLFVQHEVSLVPQPGEAVRLRFSGRAVAASPRF